jgi:hypothetical protein
MAIYSLRLTPIGKTTQKRPFTAAAHIRYIARPGAVSHVLAERMPEDKGRAQRWLRAAEKADRKNARVADKLVIALPRELTADQNLALVRAFAERLTKGRASWFAAIHARGKDRDNPHVHLLVRDRDVQTGERVVMFSAGPKEVSQRAAKGQSAPTTLNQIRELWEHEANAALAAVGRRERIDRRRLLAQGLARAPQVHEGPNIRAMHDRGYRPRSADRVFRNRPGRRRGVPAQRTVRYAAIDGGRTRVEYNEALRREARAGVAMGQTVSRTHVALAAPLSLVESIVRDERRLAELPAPMPEMVPRVPSAPPENSSPPKPLLERDGLEGARSPAYGGPMNEPIQHLEAEIADLRSRFGDARTMLVDGLRSSFRDADAVVDSLLSHADEFGPSHAAERLLVRPDLFGELAQTGNLQSLSNEDLTAALERLIDGHDDLDRLSKRRDAAEGRLGQAGQTFHIQGEAFTLDADLRSLVSADRQTVVPLGAPDRELSLAERVVQEQGTRHEPSTPAKDRETPERGR